MVFEELFKDAVIQFAKVGSLLILNGMSEFREETFKSILLKASACYHDTSIIYAFTPESIKRKAQDDQRAPQLPAAAPNQNRDADQSVIDQEEQEEEVPVDYGETIAGLVTDVAAIKSDMQVLKKDLKTLMELLLGGNQNQ
jgi:hypothetical protein